MADAMSEIDRERLTESQWIHRFLRRLSSLQPSLEIASSMRYAMRVHDDDPDINPELAAENYVGASSAHRASGPAQRSVNE